MPHGYGRFGSKYAHRVAYALTYGVEPEEMDVLHRCDNPPCIRPDHLFLGTAVTNAEDMVAKRRHAAARHPEHVARGEGHGNSKLTDDQVREIRKLNASGEFSQRQLAAMFGVTQPTIGTIVRGITRKSAYGDYLINGEPLQ